ncbi:RNA polymerase II degradation factor 1-like isoform X5 [Chenopodium quinoa]|uniref:RNA polymerase II degradation factor 1-like isoform X5 n=1 Tax=Chenopodium quinoa TaxID=63459 RepID=UPI000B773342|nr:RNA polymerase II degradation factor 1-like isoform X5 [Chenopodium quinoa]
MLRVDGLNVPLHKKQEEEEALRQEVAAGEAAMKRVDELELKVKDLQTDLKALENADKENTNLHKDVSRLKNELATNQAAHKEALEKEQLRMIEDNEADCEERMKLAWNLIHPDFEYEYFNLRYLYTSEVYEAKVLGADPPPPFDEWVERGAEIQSDEADQGAPVGDQPEVTVEQSAEIPVEPTQQPEHQQSQQQQPQQQQP